MCLFSLQLRRMVRAGREAGHRAGYRFPIAPLLQTGIDPVKQATRHVGKGSPMICGMGGWWRGVSPGNGKTKSVTPVTLILDTMA